MLICSHLFWYHVGLKIQSLRLEEREAAAKEEASADDDDAAGNGNGANDGPWKKIETAPVASDDHTEVVSEAKEVITAYYGISQYCSTNSHVKKIFAIIVYGRKWVRKLADPLLRATAVAS